MSVMKRALLVCLAIALAMSLGGAAAMADTIKVGIVLPLTGEQAKFGEIEQRWQCLGITRDLAGDDHRPLRFGQEP